MTLGKCRGSCTGALHRAHFAKRGGVHPGDRFELGDQLFAEARELCGIVAVVSGVESGKQEMVTAESGIEAAKVREVVDEERGGSQQDDRGSELRYDQRFAETGRG